MEALGVLVYKIIWSPWRYGYVKRIDREEECLFCRLQRMSDDEAYILYRGKYCYAVLNTYPYNCGHTMVSPYRHVASIEDLSRDELLEAMEIVRLVIKAMRRAFNPDGFNIGVNIGRAAGAGVEGHVHIHVVPRWTGDSNFLPVVSGYKSLPIALSETYKLLKKELESIEL